MLFDSWCVGACFPFWGVQERPKCSIPGLVCVLGVFRVRGRAPAFPSQCPRLPRTESLALCCIPEGNCGYKLLGVGKYLSDFQKPARGLAAAEAPGQDLRLAWPSGHWFNGKRLKGAEEGAKL